jgi:hypothetical protein
MVTVRPTQKLRTALPATETSLAADTALGDWYVNRLVVARRPLLLLVSSSSLLPILVPARDVRGLPGRLVDLVANRLVRLGVGASLIEAETKAMSPIMVGVTIDRSVVGIMVDFAKGVPYYLEAGHWDDTSLAVVEDRLAKTPCHASRPWEQVVFPDRKALELLAAKWAG